MSIHLLMGNEAIGRGALHAGVTFASGYPGTPSTEVLETIARMNDGSVHVEWSTNEKAALEAAIGASWAGARSLVTMKQVGLNVASDPLMTLSYLGVVGGLVLVVADDPGPISSQTEQDTRSFGRFSRVPVLDPAGSGEAYGMVQDAFEMSERYNTPVIVRPTTRVCHACGTVKTRGGVADCMPVEKFAHAQLAEDDPYWEQMRPVPGGFKKDARRFVVFPRTSFENHGRAEERAAAIAADYADGYHPNRIELGTQHHVEGTRAFRTAREGGKRWAYGIACGGIGYQYVKEACAELGLDVPVFKAATPYPFPTPLAGEFLDAVDAVVTVEELDPVIERELLELCGARGIARDIHGKLDGTFAHAGEQSVEAVRDALAQLAAGADAGEAHARRPGGTANAEATEAVPARPPVLCAGCPHRASFYAVKRAMNGRKAVFCGDIGCYTLGNAAPLDMVDTCVCMGADITVAQGIHAVEPDTTAFSFIGDSTFFASGITGVVNAVYNQHDIVVCVLDNSTTAMTGQQPHPGTGRTMMGVDGAAMSIPAVLDALGVWNVTVDPLDQNAARDAVREAAARPGVKAVIFKSPCIYVGGQKRTPLVVDGDSCIGCYACIDQIGCPAIQLRGGTVSVDTALCNGCGLCAQICPTGALRDSADAQEDAASTADEPATAPAAICRRAGTGEALNCVICGVGGQGNVLASRLVADVLLARDEHVKTAETIGMAQRGGSVASHVRGGRPYSPLVPKGRANVIIAFEPGEALRCIEFAAPGCAVVVNTSAAQPPTAALTRSSYDGRAALDALRTRGDITLVEVDGTALAAQAGSHKALNVVMLAAAVKSGALDMSREELEAAVRACVKPRFTEMNLQAVAAVFA